MRLCAIPGKRVPYSKPWVTESSVAALPNHPEHSHNNEWSGGSEADRGRAPDTWQSKWTDPVTEERGGGSVYRDLHQSAVGCQKEKNTTIREVTLVEV